MNVKVTREALLAIAEKRIDHILKANHDYGDAWQTNGPFTPLLRMKEKLIRVETLSDGRQAMIQDEKVETNVAEVFDYSMLWMLWHEYNSQRWIDDGRMTFYEFVMRLGDTYKQYIGVDRAGPGTTDKTIISVTMADGNNAMFDFGILGEEDKKSLIIMLQHLWGDYASR